MEKRLVRSSIYGLLLALAVAILFVDYKDVSQVSEVSTVTTYKPILDYIISILRIGIIGMFLGLFIGWKDYERRYKVRQGKTHYLLFFFIVFIVSAIVMVIFNW